MLLQEVQGELLGMTSPLTVFYLGIGPYINASWAISAIMIAKLPAPLYRHFQTLRRAGREVYSFSHSKHHITLPT
jgi:preprotein translocase subunit SecY